MKKQPLFLFAIVFFAMTYNVKAQTANDTILMDNEIVGNLAGIKNGVNQEGQTTTTFEVKLYRDITPDEKKFILERYNPGNSSNRSVVLRYSPEYQSNQSIAGHLLYEAGKLKSQANSMYITAGITALAGSLIAGYMVKEGDDNMIVPVITISTTSVMSIVGLVKDYKANRKIREAGVFLQKR